MRALRAAMLAATLSVVTFAQSITLPGYTNPNVSLSWLYYNKMRWAGAWSSTTNYNPQDVTTYGGYTYVSQSVANLNHIPAPGGTAYWSPLPTNGSGFPTGSQLGYLRIQPNTGVATSYQFTAPPLVVPADYKFPAQTPGGTLIQNGANQSIALSPCPLGVSGSDIGHSLYISGGTGTAESVLITGGTCTGGAATGTVTVTPTQPHSGAWTIQSATDGMDEAAKANPTLNVYLPCGTYNLYAGIIFASGQSVTGEGYGCVTVMRRFTAGTMLKITGGTTSGFSTDSAVATVSGWDLDFEGGDPHVHDIRCNNSLNQILFNGTGRAKVTNLAQLQWAGTGIKIGDTLGAYVEIANHVAGSVVNNSIFLDLHYASVQLSNFNYQMVGTGNSCILMDPSSPGYVSESNFVNGVLDSCDYAIRMVGTGSKYSLKFASIYIDNIGVSGFSTDIHSVSVALTDIQFVGFKGVGAAGDITLAGGSDITLNGVRIADQQYTVPYGIAIGYGAPTSGVFIHGGAIGITQAGATDANLTAPITIGNSSSNINIGADVTVPNRMTAVTVGTGVTGFLNGLNAQNYIASSSGGANAITASLPGVTVSDGWCTAIVLGYGLQAGANTLALNGSTPLAVKSHLNPANNIATPYVAGARWAGCYSSTGPVWLDSAQ